MRVVVVTTDIADLAMQGFGSIENCRFFCEALGRLGYQSSLMVVGSEDDLASLVHMQADLIVAGIKFLVFSDLPISKVTPGKIWLAEYMSRHQLPFTGSPHQAIEMDFDKIRAKQRIQALGLATADAFVATPDSALHPEALPLSFPLFVKPLFESDSRGIDMQSLVCDPVHLKQKIRSIDRLYHQPALVEAYLPGREFTVAILDSRPAGDLLVCAVEIINLERARKGHPLTFLAKKKNRELLVPVADPLVRNSVEQLAWQSFQALGARDFGRIDIKMDAAGSPHFLEANLLPGMNPVYSYFPEAFRLVHGLAYDDLAGRMLAAATDRLYHAIT
jgi:D-alanine-D-alanine ligase